MCLSLCSGSLTLTSVFFLVICKTTVKYSCIRIYNRTFMIAASVCFVVLNDTSRHRTCLLLLQLVAQDTNNKTACNRIGGPSGIVSSNGIGLRSPNCIVSFAVWSLVCRLQSTGFLSALSVRRFCCFCRYISLCEKLSCSTLSYFVQGRTDWVGVNIVSSSVSLSSAVFVTQ